MRTRCKNYSWTGWGMRKSAKGGDVMVQRHLLLFFPTERCSPRAMSSSREVKHKIIRGVRTAAFDGQRRSPRECRFPRRAIRPNIRTATLRIMRDCRHHGGQFFLTCGRQSSECCTLRTTAQVTLNTRVISLKRDCATRTHSIRRGATQQQASDKALMTTV